MDHELLAYILLGLTRGSMYALIALGYTLVYGVLQLINFAHSEVFMFGAFGSYIVVHQIVGAGGHQNPVGVRRESWPSGCSPERSPSAGIAWVLERVAYRPLRKRGAPKLAFLISAIGASFFLVQLAGKLFNRFTGNAFPSYFRPTGGCSASYGRRARAAGLDHRHRGDHDVLPRPPGRLENQTRPQHPRLSPRMRRPRP